MTTITLNGKRIQATIQQKARRLLANIREIGEQGALAVISDSDCTKAYEVKHNGRQSTGCACKHCKNTGNGGCSYRQAVDWWLEARNREQYCSVFGIYE